MTYHPTVEYYQAMDRVRLAMLCEACMVQIDNVDSGKLARQELLALARAEVELTVAN